MFPNARKMMLISLGSFPSGCSALLESLGGSLTGQRCCCRFVYQVCSVAPPRARRCRRLCARSRARLGRGAFLVLPRLRTKFFLRELEGGLSIRCSFFRQVRLCACTTRCAQHVRVCVRGIPFNPPYHTHNAKPTCRYHFTWFFVRSWCTPPPTHTHTNTHVHARTHIHTRARTTSTRALFPNPHHHTPCCSTRVLCLNSCASLHLDHQK